MNTFQMILRDTVRSETIEGVSSFIGEDASGRFGILANHMRMMTKLIFGLARFRVRDEPWQYLAMPGAMLYFADNEMALNTRRFIRSDNYEDISQALTEILSVEEQALMEMKHTLRRIEENTMRYMIEIEKYSAGK